MGPVVTYNTQQVLSKLLRSNLIGNDESKTSTTANNKQDHMNSSHGEFTKRLDQENNKLERTG